MAPPVGELTNLNAPERRTFFFQSKKCMINIGYGALVDSAAGGSLLCFFFSFAAPLDQDNLSQKPFGIHIKCQ